MASATPEAPVLPIKEMELSKGKSPRIKADMKELKQKKPDPILHEKKVVKKMRKSIGKNQSQQVILPANRIKPKG